ncbi:Putative DNA topoisomerase 2, mitochondrial [Caenorhabditis elegans]|uniref:Putative DNA topoisomerase 2, mitochondrial n=3 Tax=Caenorhabditis elegans TaxID=6239 RepID=TOP2M_CAEEL|nr:Putative DNA topoisomerase 2, mitochondrial [Caenorhabditis elegans]P34534.5 RecName: Full=Putative DNA topoisomerase 2, mitochondrial; Short=DNA topoisomerase II; Flags: Precursor [Caenorhabditis elegans]CCD73199.1 Putative DNA topoisomerase 2, mitochondrial [Caenorhabditis elegans]|eukprot:NP_741252.2 Putative DNA topoisomerase 2, mitochondrial [Caenorhabditis elegans]
MHRLRVLRHLKFCISTSHRTTVVLKNTRSFCNNIPSTSFASEAAAKYEKKSPTEHVLLRPDTYIGGVAMREDQIIWLRDSENRKMIAKEVTYPPGLLKIFDEILVNAADNKARDSSMNRLEVWLDRETARISVWNNGSGLPVEIHPTEGIYVPTLVFGNLFTSSNYDDSEIKTVGGRNGYGAKLCNIFSKEFIVETVDTRIKRRFRQKWYDNMKKCNEAEVVEILDETVKDYTKVEFVPDLERFQIDKLSDDVIDLIGRRVFEVAATLPRDVDVYLNGQKCDVDGFEDYVKMFNDSSSLLFLHPTPRWHVGVAKRNNFFGESHVVLPKIVSFVNNINTEKGGSHVDYVMDKIVNIIKPIVDSKLGDPTKSVKPAVIKNNLSIFINCLIENPSFESQTKETLTTKAKNFGSIFECDAKKTAEWAEQSGLIEDIVEEVLNMKKKKLPGKRVSVSSVRDIVKLEDAEWAGITGTAEKCTLILTEGDSAKALALAGLEVLGRETYGVFPLKGKLLNVSNLDDARASKNEEISNLLRILGLKFEDSNSITRESLRYGRLLILADQDEDGSHIKGLIVNFIHKFWPSLVHTDGFIQSFRTPLLKAKKGDKVRSFFSMNEYRKWADVEEGGKWKIKYYKGLGTSTSNEAREYFSDLDHHTVNFKYTGTTDDDAIRMAFDRDKSDERKEWIRRSENEITNEDDGKTEISYQEFVDGQLMQFGMVDLKRSIPSLIDGLKPSQRKILWTLLNNMDESTEIKVSQLAGAVAHRQSYHHGEESLVRTIIRMGQTFCGSSNLPLLQPIGQFGTRHEGGNDAASARYIFTALAPTTRLLFPQADDDLLQKNVEEGMVVEPTWLCPIVPLILINGTEGIGTGWSTKIANRNPIDIIDMIRRKIDSISTEYEIPPFYEEFRGKLEVVTPTKFISSGKIQLIRPERKNASTFSIEIVELPIGIWTSKYKEKLSKIVETLPVLEFSERHTEKRVHFRITLDRKKSSRFLQKSNSDLLNYFKLRTSLTENRVLFDRNGELKEFGNISEIAAEFFEVRRDLYEKRLKIQKEECEAKLIYVENQLNFIEMVTNGTIEIRSMGRNQLEEKLQEMGFRVDPMATIAKNSKKANYGYLLEMPVSRLTSDEMKRLEERKSRRRTELEAAESADWKSVWRSELDKLAEAVGNNRKS